MQQGGGMLEQCVQPCELQAKVGEGRGGRGRLLHVSVWPICMC
jgi:hypothetical protein